MHTEGTLQELIDHALQMHGWSCSAFTGKKRKESERLCTGVLACEFDRVKYPGSDDTDWEQTIANNPTIDEVKQLPGVASAYLSESCDPTKGVFVGRLIATIDAPITDKSQAKAALEVFHRDIETATGRTIADRCGTDVSRFWGGLKSPDHLLFVKPDLISYKTDDLLQRAKVEVIAKDPYKYQKRSGNFETNEDVSEATLFVVRWIFANILPPPDGDSYNDLVTPAKALARLAAPSLDEAFCNWIGQSDYRMSKIGNDPVDFLYRGDPFDNASIGWFIRAVDKQVPDWRDLFEVEFGAYPGLDDFNPNKKLPGMVN